VSIAIERGAELKEKKIGIGDIRIYVPRMRLALSDLVSQRITDDPSLEKHFNRALAVTGQRAIRFPAPGEDSVTMAAEAAYELMADNSGRALANLRYIASGTETSVDHSKPIASYVQGMLQRSGLPVPSSLATFQVQHACAGGTLGIQSVAGMIAASGREETGLVVASDIARYTVRSTAELTHGAGAAAVLVETDPRLLEFDLGATGYHSSDVDDFFRPIGSVTAKVKGSYSMECYNQSLDEAFQDHAARSGRSPADMLADTDLVVLHTPFRNMPEMAMKKLLASHLGLNEHESIGWLEERGFYRGVDPIAEIGNSYSASLYVFMAFLLKDRHEKLGDAIIGKRLLVASYGSGNIMTVTTATVSAGAPEIIKRWDLAGLMAAGLPATVDDYERWTEGYGMGYGERVTPGEAASRFRLVGIREDGFREYDHERADDDRRTQGQASVDMPRPVTSGG